MLFAAERRNHFGIVGLSILNHVDIASNSRESRGILGNFASKKAI